MRLNIEGGVFAVRASAFLSIAQEEEIRFFTCQVGFIDDKRPGFLAPSGLLIPICVGPKASWVTGRDFAECEECSASTGQSAGGSSVHAEPARVSEMGGRWPQRCGVDAGSAQGGGSARSLSLLS